MQIIDTFSGIGGFSYAGAMMGWRTVQFCEMNEFCNKILSFYWPGVPIHTDIKTLTADQIINNGLYDKNETTILTGGVPCQPWSLAGKRKGEEDDRNLWPQTIKLIGSLQPDFAVLENVPGFLNWNKGIFLEQMLTSLEAEGYEVFPVILPACGVNAPHKRERVWFVAFRKDKRSNEESEYRNGITPNPDIGSRQKHGLCTGRSLSKGTATSNSSNTRIEGMRKRKNEVYESATTPDPHGLRGDKEYELQQSELHKQSGKEGVIAKSGIQRCNNGSNNREERYIQKDKGVTSESKSERKGWKCGVSKIGSDVTNPTRSSSKRKLSDRQGKGESGGCDSTNITNWEDFPTQPPLCGRDDGLSARLDGITFPKWRNESIKGYGNAIVPQVVYQIFKAIESIHEIN